MLYHFWAVVNFRPVRLAYQPPANSTFLSEQTSHQQSASSTFLSEQISTSHQPPAKRTGCLLVGYLLFVQKVYFTPRTYLITLST
jgi:hypothetical protein